MAEWRSRQTRERRTQLATGDPEKARARERARAERRKADPAWRHKQKARWTVQNAIVAGKLERLPCEVCGVEPAEGHHDDYDLPLEVRWLCKLHHDEHHLREARREAETQLQLPLTA